VYLRFISAERGHMRRCALGIFQSSYYIEHDSEQPLYYRQAIRQELDWFNRWLDVTSDMDDRGVCWFKAGSQDMIRHARALAFWISECGLIIAELRTANPGQILYADDHQVFAIPHSRTPTRWRQAR